MDTETQQRSRRAKIGWWILLFIVGLMILNGVSWFFAGPATTPANMAKAAGMPVEQFRASFGEIISYHARTTRQVAVWYAAFGAMSLVVCLEGLRHGSRWAWMATWLVMVPPTLIGIVYADGIRIGGEAAVLLSFGGLALIGQLLAKPGRSDLERSAGKSSRW
jgi:hypothetical protein